MGELFGLISLGIGLYCLYAAYLLKTKGQINRSIMLPKDVDENTCKDIEGYRREMQIPLFILGAVVTLYGISDLYNTSVGGVDVLFIVMFVLTAVVLVYYFLKLRACNKKYFGI
jgi:hypothetical protein